MPPVATDHGDGPARSPALAGLTTRLFGLISLIGLAGAFVGLTTSSFWADELYTAWVLGDGRSFNGALARMVTDAVPPGFYITLFGFCRLFGVSDTSLRLFSALCATGAVAVFLVALRRHASLTARLFAAALATTSSIWFFQAQNARSNSLTFLLGAILLGLSLRLIEHRTTEPRRQGGTLAVLGGVMAYGSTVHFYFLYECLAVLIVLAAYAPRYRPVLILFGGVLVAGAGAYTGLFIRQHSQLALSANWIPNTPRWYATQLYHALLGAAAPLALTVLAIAAGCWIRSRRPGRAAVRSWSDARNRLSRIDPLLALCAGVPVILVGGALTSSILLTPNLTDRNLLVCSPFLWGLYALAYDRGVRPAPLPLKRLAEGVLAGLLVASAAVVLGRWVPRNEPFREAAAWIATVPGCREQDILVVTSDEKAWSAPGYMEQVIAAETGHYLQPFAQPRVAYMEDVMRGRLPGSWSAELARRLDGDRCPVLAWWPRRIDASQLPALTAALAAGAGQPGARGRIKVRGFAAYSSEFPPRLTEPQAYVFYADTGQAR